MTITKRLSLLLALPLFTLFALGTVASVWLTVIEDKSRLLTETQVASLALVGDISQNMAEMRLELRSFLLLDDPATAVKRREQYHQNKKLMEGRLATYGDKLIVGDKDRRLLNEFLRLSTEYSVEAERIFELASAGRKPEAIQQVLSGNLPQIGSRLSALSETWIEHNKAVANEAGRQNLEGIDRAEQNMIICIVASMVFTGFLGFRTFGGIVKPIRSLEASVEAIAGGDYKVEVPFTAEVDEIGALARSIEVLKRGAAGVEQHRWVKTSVAKISTAVQGSESLNDFGDRLLCGLIPLLGGGVGGFYLLDKSQQKLDRAASYGLLAKESFQLGESLVGQCAINRTSISIKSLPPTYLQISSGLGSATPAEAIAWPLMSRDNVLGVLELATFQTLGPQQQALLEELIPTVSMSLEILSRNLALASAKLKAEAATDAKSMFLANMSHEIRTPMNAILGMTHLALKTELTAKQRDYLSKVRGAANSLLGIISDVLDFSKIEAGKLDIESAEFRFDDVLNNLGTVVGQKAHDKYLEFLIDVQPGIPQALVGDPLRLGQILINLVNNSIKFTEKGEVVVRVEHGASNGSRIELKFSVRDTGIGMSPDQSAKLFQAFTQADTSTTRKFGGTGLGLSISRRLVELMDGRIWVDSAIGKGSTFHFTAWFGVGANRETRKLVPDLTGMRALVVDDNAQAREILGSALRGFEFRVKDVASGQEALKELAGADSKDPYQLVLMDWNMPGMDGVATSKSIRQELNLSRPPRIVMVTAFGRDDVRAEAESVGVDGYLVKPVNASTLYDCVMDMFGTITTAETVIVSAGPSLEGIRILLTEDNEINQQIATELLESAGAIVTVANHGGMAVEMLQSACDPLPYDVVLMDLQMPEMDGHTATRLIRANPRFANLPILAMTAHALVEERQRCIEDGMNDHITKPIDPDALFATVARWSPKRGETLESIPGLDVQAGLKRVAGNDQLYRSLLKQFSDKQLGALDQLEVALSDGNRELAERLVHTLKGVAGNLGLGRIQSEAAELEKTFSTLKVRELRLLVIPVVTQIRKVLNAVKPPKVALDRAAFQRLGSLIAANDGEAVAAFESLGLTGLDELRTAILAFDFDTALVKWEEAVEGCK